MMVKIRRILAKVAMDGRRIAYYIFFETSLQHPWDC